MAHFNTRSTLGFIGLGNMGLPMALNLLKQSYSLCVYDLNPQAVANAVSCGAVACDSLEQLVTQVSVCITMLPSGVEVRKLYLGQEGLLTKASKNTLFIDCSTIEMDLAQQLAHEAQLQNRGLQFLDAPVSGGVSGATQATLTFMVGGDQTALMQTEPIFSAMGQRVLHMGAAGMGQAAKMCNNMLLGITMIGVCEAFVLAERVGLPAEKLFAVSTSSSGQCWSMSSYCPVPGFVPAAPSNREYRQGFNASLMLKDLNLAQYAAQLHQAATPLAAKATELYQQFSQEFPKELDFSAIILWLRQQGVAK